VALLAYICLFTFRVLGSIVILGKACDLIEDHKQKQQQKKKQSVEEAKDLLSGGTRLKEALKTDTVTQQPKHKEEMSMTSLLSHRKTLEPVPAQRKVQTTEEEEDDCSGLFQLPDRSSERLFLFQNSCDDKADVLLTNMNVALLDSPEPEQRTRDTTPAMEVSSEGDLSDRDTQKVAFAKLVVQHTLGQHETGRPGSQLEALRQQDADQGRIIGRNSPIPHIRQEKPEDRATRKVAETLFPLEAGLSPASKAKSLSSPDLIRSEADFEEWESEQEGAEQEERLLFSAEGLASLESVRKRGVVERP
jgi:hypothetical protein